MKKEKLLSMSRIMLAVAAFVCIFAIGGNKAEARYYGSLSNLTQTAETENSVTISWAAPTLSSKETVTAYLIGYGADYETAKAMLNTTPIRLDPSTYSYTFTGLSAGTSYHVYVYYTSRQQRYDGTIRETEPSSIGSGEIRTTPGVVTSLNQSKWWRWAKAVDVEWDNQNGVDGYEYVFTTHKGTIIDQGIVDSARYSHSISNTVIYKIKVRAYSNIDGRMYYSAWTPECYLMIQPSKGEDYAEVNAKISGGKLHVSWKKLDGASGYNVYASTKLNSGYKKLKSVKAKKNSVVSKFGKKSFKPGKTYYIYVQAYKNVGGRKVTTGVNYVTVLKGNRTSFTYID